jgi:CBS-domain-containing membrane protein
MITDRDICIALGTRSRCASEVRVKDVSLSRVFTCGAYDDAQQALKTMVSQNVRRLPVVDEHGKIAGILSIDDLMRHAQESARGGGISYREVVRATKAILEDRSADHVHKPAELVATHA